MDKEKAIKNLSEISRVLKAHDIDHWIDSGTLLGMYRDKDFIEHDTDTDIGIKAEDCDSIPELIHLFGSFLTLGYRLYHTFGTLNRGYEIALWKDGIKTDLFWFYEKGDKRWFALWNNAGRNGESDMIKMVISNKYFKELQDGNFKGYSIPVPEAIEEYLVERYGKDWRIPKKDWKWNTSPVCINNNFEI